MARGGGCWARLSGRLQQETLVDRPGASLRSDWVVGWVGRHQRCRQAGNGRDRNRARARLNWVSQGQCCGRCRVRRRADRVSRPAIEQKRRRRVLVVTTCSPRPMRTVQRASNCVGCQAGWAISAGHEPRHGELSLTMAFRMVSSLRMQATKATFFALPAASSLW